MAKKDKTLTNTVLKSNPASSSVKGERTQFILAIIACIALPFIIYSNSLHAPFILDDTAKIVDNPDIKSLSGIWKKLIYPYDKTRFEGNRNDPSRPIVYLTFALNYHFGRLNPFGYHLVNIALHIANTLLIFLLAKIIFSRVFGEPSMTFPIFTALLFASHPVNVGVVTYIFSRSDLLSTLFYLSSILLFEKTIQKNRWFIIPSVISFILAIFSKQSAITLPAILLLFDYIVLSKYDMKQVMQRKYFHIVYWGTIIGYLVYRFLLFQGLGDLEAQELFYRSLYIMNQPLMIFKYIKMLIYPTGLCLDHMVLPEKFITNPKIFKSVIFIAGIIAVLIFMVLRKKDHYYKMISFSLLWFLIVLSPTSSFFSTTSLFVENRMYLSGIGFFLAITSTGKGISKIISDNYLKKAVIVSFFVYVLMMGLLSRNRNKIYNEPFRLWQEVVSLYPTHWRAHSAIGVLYENNGNYDLAEKSYFKAVEIRPWSYEIWSRLGTLYFNVFKDVEKAKRCFLKAVEINPNDKSANNNLGAIYYKQGNNDSALKHFLISYQNDDKNGALHNNIGLVYYSQSMFKEAIPFFEKALELEPDASNIYYNLGLVYLNLQEYDKALMGFEMAAIKGFDQMMSQKKIDLCREILKKRKK